MYIAKQKRKENIAEYVLYMWQIEDLIRAFNFDMQRFFDTIVAPQSLSAEQQQSAYCWYEDIATLLSTEGKRERGHIEHIEHLVADIHDLHLRLLSLPIGAKYSSMFNAIIPNINTLRGELKDGKNSSDTEIMFRALYSVILLRLKGVEAPSHINDVIEVISPVVAQLALYYHKVESGEVDLFKE